jgi:hypothetical protein
MATVAAPISTHERHIDLLSGTPRAHMIDRWIYVITAASFIVITLTGFIPDSLMKIDMVRTGARPPFPIVLHMHAVLMGSFLLFLLSQTWLMATGRNARHMQLGIVGAVLAAALVVVGFILAPTMYHQVWDGAQHAPSPMREVLQDRVLWLDNVLLLQMRIGLLFPLFLTIGLLARGKDAGLHKRMMILATAMALPAGIDRITWLPTTMPESPLAADLYTLLAVSPMFIWDVVRNRYVHKAYWIWLGVGLPFAVAVNLLWDTDGWHATARQVMGV